MKSVKIHRISIDSLALSVIPSGCRVEDLFFDLEMRKRVSPTAISAKALHVIYGPLISVDPTALGVESGGALALEYPLE